MKSKTAALSIAILLLIALLPAASATLSAAGSFRGQGPVGMVDADFESERPAPPDLTLTVTPYNPPIIIPASGGTFQYAAEVKNNGAAQAAFDVWTAIQRPDGSTVPGAGPFRIRVPGGWSAGREDLTQEIVATDPPGAYFYLAHVGRFPDLILATESFNFEKLAGGGWFLQSSGTSEWLFDVHFADANNGWAVGLGTTIMHTSNGGELWAPQSAPISSNLFGVFAVDAEHAWAGGWLAAILHTADSGATWVAQDSGYPGAFSWSGFYFLDANNGWAVGGKPADFTAARRVILHTTNGGATWQTQYSQTNEDYLNAVYFVDANHGWAVGNGDGILHTSNGGSTWLQQSSGTGDYLEDVYFTDVNNGWAVGPAGTAIHTTDGGATWVVQDLGVTDDLLGVHFADMDNGWISGTDQTYSQAIILRTDDGGVTWHYQDPGPVLILNSIVFSDASNGWAVGDAGKIIHTDTGGE